MEGGREEGNEGGHSTKPNQIWFEQIEKLNLHLKD